MYDLLLIGLVISLKYLENRDQIKPAISRSQTWERGANCFFVGWVERERNPPNRQKWWVSFHSTHPTGIDALVWEREKTAKAEDLDSNKYFYNINMNIKNNVISKTYTPIAQHTRFLYPFFMERNKVTEAVAALQTLTHSGRNKTHPIWEAIDKPFGFYRQEMLERVTQFLFSGQPGSCRYLKVNINTANIWFGEEVHSSRVVSRF